MKTSHTDVFDILQQLLERFRQVHAEFSDEKIHVQLSKKFKVMWKSEKIASEKVADLIA